MIEFSARPLAGKKGVILGIANEHSIAYGCAQAFRGLGADVALTYSGEKAKPHVEPLAKALEAPIFLPCDVRAPEQLENVFQVIEKTWGKLDFALHSIASAPKQDLHSPLSQCSRDGFLQAMDVSCYSFIRMAHLAASMMRDGGTILTMTYYGAEKVIENYNVMGAVKAALESSVRYLASEFGSLKIDTPADRIAPRTAGLQLNAVPAADRIRYPA
jgi:enoyl-[acyl-carrier protein] reductase I